MKSGQRGGCLLDAAIAMSALLLVLSGVTQSQASDTHAQIVASVRASALAWDVDGVAAWTRLPQRPR
ncbi:hypothetical protein PTE30175_02082 [Pandoraea terrae]|uniref:Uncharacterized protein n=1 Tax=Pandoraea terrae TaxID=1537710 RepID=A0A5E4UPJ6_9BURK|nr:hypothetical protein PTE30175_02082 [Pandoraea terrae]